MIFCAVLICATMLWAAPAPAAPSAAGTRLVELPLTLDYPFLRAALLRSWFTLPGEQALAAQADGGCTMVTLDNPRVGPDGEHIALTVGARVKAGVKVWGGCFKPVDWRGQVELQQKVWVDPATLHLRVATVSSRILDSRGEPTVVGQVVWKLIHEHVHAYLDQFTVNLAPPLTDLRVQLPLMVRPAMQARILGWLDTLEPAGVAVGPEAVSVTLAMRVDLPPSPAREETPPAPPTPEQTEAFIRFWEAWDAYLVNQILSLAQDDLEPAEKAALGDTLLEMRYGFVQALQDPAAHPDLVRRQLLKAWRRLGPILRRHLWGRPGDSLYSYLALFTAMDAIKTLDELGPSVGLEITPQGLRRLAHLLNPGSEAPSLDYGQGEDPRLRQLLDMGPPLERPDLDPALPPKWEGFSRLVDWLVPVAWAREKDQPLGQDLAPWLPPEDGEVADYLSRVRAVLDQAADQALAKGRLGKEHHGFFRDLELATAWQESCWRQFKNHQGQAVPLMSYNNSSVGVMQVNQRVWRGLYHLPSLRWSIDYNAQAGGEILELYIRRYALARMKDAEHGDHDLLARLVYAMYNGGPGQYARLRQRLGKDRLLLSDKLFWQKYQWAREGAWDRLKHCLTGG